MKKTLLIFFGELRTFEHVIPHLKNLDEVDVMVSTWIQSNYNGVKFDVDETKIRNIYSDVKYFNIIDFNKIEDFDSKTNSWKLFYHWKTSINNLENLEEYDTIMFHRCDLLSNWHSILDINVENDVLYLHTDIYPEIYKPHGFGVYWVNDYYFFGKPNIVKRFINLLNNDDESVTSHSDMSETISKNNIKIKNLFLRGQLIRKTINTDVQNLPPDVSTMAFITGPSNNILM